MPPEMRVVATLIRAQFRHDMKFRMSVLGILPLTVLYLYMSIEDGVLPDPFVDATLGTLGDLTLLHMAVLLMPVLLMTSITYSESAGAAWVFFTTPARAPRLVRHSKNVLLLFFVLPYLVVVGALLAWFFEAWWHAAIHVVVLGLVTNLGLQFAVLATPRLPFSQPVQKARQGGRVLPMFFGVGVVLVLLTLLMAVAYGSWAGIAWAVAGLGLINVLLEVAVSNKVARRMEGLEFAA